MLLLVFFIKNNSELLKIKINFQLSQFSTQIEDVIVKACDTGVFICEVVQENDNVKWSVNGNEVGADHKFNIVNDGKLQKLTIFHSNRSYNGSEVIVAVNDDNRSAMFYVGGKMSII